MYYCSICAKLSHYREEVVCIYCPNCLFEVPTASAQSGRGKCARNCLSCPVCASITSVMSDDTIYVECGACQWSSNSIGLKFTKPTGLGSHLTQLEQTTDAFKTFTALETYYKSLARYHRASTPVGSNSKALTASNALLFGGDSFNDLPEYSPSFQDESTQLMEGPQMNMSQFLSSLSNIDQGKPVKVSLRTKRMKRCVKCDHILVKPEPKVSSIGFTVKQTAYTCLPRVTLVSSDDLIRVLRIVNPLPQCLKIRILSPENLNVVPDCFDLETVNSWDTDDEIPIEQIVTVTLETCPKSETPLWLEFTSDSTSGFWFWIMDS